MSLLEVKGLKKVYKTRFGGQAVEALKNVNFTVEEGEYVAIMGESGSGKSVTTRAVMGILAGNAMVDGGEIIYDGRDLLKIPEEGGSVRSCFMTLRFDDGTFHDEILMYKKLN